MGGSLSSTSLPCESRAPLIAVPRSIRQVTLKIRWTLPLQSTTCAGLNRLRGGQRAAAGSGRHGPVVLASLGGFCGSTGDLDLNSRWQPCVLRSPSGDRLKAETRTPLHVMLEAHPNFVQAESVQLDNQGIHISSSVGLSDPHQRAEASSEFLQGLIDVAS